MSMRQLVCRVTIDDCVVQTFCAGGKGGSNQNAKATGVRIIHPPSGAVGECREQRHQLQNKRTAFRRMGESPAFQTWVRRNEDSPLVEASSERIRTYNLVERRVKDHRTGDTTSKVQDVLDGDIDAIYS